MNKQQYERAHGLLAKDCEVAEEYFAAGGKTCAIGCLLKAVGITSLTSDQNETAVYFLDVEVLAKLCQEFGLTLGELRMIQEANDSEILDVERRRAAVLGRLDRFRANYALEEARTAHG